MSDSPQALAAGSQRELNASLVLRSLFKSLPSGIVIDAFRRHVADTGSPETFDHISTTRPPDSGRLSVLTEFHAPRGKRPRGDLAPCPICSPGDPQFLHGILIWCEATAAIYAIGLDCGGKLWRDGRLDQAVAAWEKTEHRRAVEDSLLGLLPSVPELRHWVADHLSSAQTADRLTKGFRRKARGVYAVVKEAFTRGGALVAPAGLDGIAGGSFNLTGAGFLKSNFDSERRLKSLELNLSFLDFGDDELGCIDGIANMSPVEQVKALKWLRAAHSEAEKIHGYLHDCAEFLTPANMAALRAWSDAPNAPFRIFAQAEKGRVKIYVYQGHDDWFDQLDGLRSPDSPPEV